MKIPALKLRSLINGVSFIRTISVVQYSYNPNIVRQWDVAGAEEGEALIYDFECKLQMIHNNYYKDITFSEISDFNKRLAELKSKFNEFA